MKCRNMENCGYECFCDTWRPGCPDLASVPLIREQTVVRVPQSLFLFGEDEITTTTTAKTTVPATTVRTTTTTISKILKTENALSPSQSETTGLSMLPAPLSKQHILTVPAPKEQSIIQVDGSYITTVATQDTPKQNGPGMIPLNTSEKVIVTVSPDSSRNTAFSDSFLSTDKGFQTTVAGLENQAPVTAADSVSKLSAQPVNSKQTFSSILLFPPSSSKPPSVSLGIQQTLSPLSAATVPHPR